MQGRQDGARSPSPRSSSQRRGGTYPSSLRGAHKSSGSSDGSGTTDSQARIASAGAPLQTVRDPNALESFDDLIREQQDHQQQQQSRTVSMPATTMQRTLESGTERSSIDDDHHAADHLETPVGSPVDATSSSITVRAPPSQRSPQGPGIDAVAAAAADAGDTSFSSQHRPRDEQRWNGWHLWRMESYNRRVSAQQAADEEDRRAQQSSWPLQKLQITFAFVARRVQRARRSLLPRQDQENANVEGGEEPGSAQSEANARGDVHDPTPPQRPLVPTHRMILLTLVLSGVQVAWCLEFGYGTPYLLSIGLSKSVTSLVWLAAPVSGLVVQPLVGVLSDLSNSPCRRRQFILGSTLVVALCTLVLAFSSVLASGLTDVLHAGLADWDPVRLQARDDLNRLLAVVAFISLDISINGVQASARALILDVTPSELHSQVNAWGARMMHAGSVFGYAAGWYDLSSARWLGWIGAGQFRKYSLVSLLFVTMCSVVTCLSIQEDSPAPLFEDDISDRASGDAEDVCSLDTGRMPAVTRADSPMAPQYQTTFSEQTSEAFSHVWQSIRRLPRPVRRICLVQLFAHMGWFPFLVYGSEWVIETRRRSGNDKHDSAIDDRATEAGSFALLMFAIVSLTSGILLPYLALSHSPSNSVRLDGPEDERASLQEAQKGPKRSWRLTLRTIWTVSLIIYGTLAAFGTLFVQNMSHSIVLVACVGVPWAVAVWVPYALVMESVREAEDGTSPYEFEADWFAPERVRRRRRDSRHNSSSQGSGGARVHVDRALRDCGPLVGPRSRNASRDHQRNKRSGSQQHPRLPTSILARGADVIGSSGGRSASHSASPSRNHLPGVTDSNGTLKDNDQRLVPQQRHDHGASLEHDSVGGTILGIHNMAIVIPQLLTALTAAAILRDHRVSAVVAAAASTGAAAFDRLVKAQLSFAPALLSDTLLGSSSDGNGKGVGVVWVIRVGGLAAFVAAALTRLVPLTRTERLLMENPHSHTSSNGGDDALASFAAHAPRFDDEASDNEDVEEDAA